MQRSHLNMTYQVFTAPKNSYIFRFKKLKIYEKLALREAYAIVIIHQDAFRYTRTLSLQSKIKNK